MRIWNLLEWRKFARNLHWIVDYGKNATINESIKMQTHLRRMGPEKAFVFSNLRDEKSPFLPNKSRLATEIEIPNAHTQWYLVYITWKILFQFTHHSSFVRYIRKLNQFNDIRTTITNSRLYVFIFVIKRKILGIAIKNGK